MENKAFEAADTLNGTRGKFTVSITFWIILLYAMPNSTEERGLRSTFMPREMLQNLLCLCFFIFHFEQLWVLPLWMPCSMLTKTRAFIRVKLKVAGNEKWKKKNTWVFFSHKHNKLWSISLGQKVDCKPLLSEEWPTEPLECFVQPHGRPKSFIEKFHSNIIHS